MKTEQEDFWAGTFGNEYVQRNQSPALLAANRALFAQILRRTRKVSSLIELGANIGMNLRAIRELLPSAELAGVEINASAAEQLSQWGGATVFNQSILEFAPERTWDLSLSKGTLIHIQPDSLPVAYDALHRASSRYVCVVEYYNPSPMGMPYRGHADKLFKRDFAGELMERHPDLALIDYGFVYRRDPNFAQDDVTWFLMEKTS